MIEISDSFQQYSQLVYIVAGFGALGGLAYELLQSRFDVVGALALPRFYKGGVLALGWLANMILGAITALAFLYVFPPVTQVTTVINTDQSVAEQQDSNDAISLDENIASEYDIIKVIALSVIAGSAGPTFLTSLQARVLVAVKAQEAETVRSVANSQVEALAEQAKLLQAKTNGVQQRYAQQKQNLQDLANAAAAATPATIHTALMKSAATTGKEYTIPDTHETIALGEPLADIEKRIDETLNTIDQELTLDSIDFDMQLKQARKAISATSERH